MRSDAVDGAAWLLPGAAPWFECGPGPSGIFTADSLAVESEVREGGGGLREQRCELRSVCNLSPSQGVAEESLRELREKMAG
jgi:hypothetical protein